MEVDQDPMIHFPWEARDVVRVHARAHVDVVARHVVFCKGGCGGVGPLTIQDAPPLVTGP